MSPYIDATQAGIHAPGDGSPRSAVSAPPATSQPRVPSKPKLPLRLCRAGCRQIVRNACLSGRGSKREASGRWRAETRILSRDQTRHVRKSVMRSPAQGSQVWHTPRACRGHPHKRPRHARISPLIGRVILGLGVHVPGPRRIVLEGRDRSDARSVDVAVIATPLSTQAAIAVPT